MGEANGLRQELQVDLGEDFMHYGQLGFHGDGRNAGARRSFGAAHTSPLLANKRGAMPMRANFSMVLTGSMFPLLAVRWFLLGR